MSTIDAPWRPHVTVAAVIEDDGRFLVIEEETEQGLRFNQPAGHLEPGETLCAAVRRETLEETTHRFEPGALVGIYRHTVEPDGTTYLRFAFSGALGARVSGRVWDAGIVRTVWLTTDELRATAARHRTPLVLRCVEDYLAGVSYPLELLKEEKA